MDFYQQAQFRLKYLIKAELQYHEKQLCFQVAFFWVLGIVGIVSLLSNSCGNKTEVEIIVATKLTIVLFFFNSFVDLLFLRRIRMVLKMIESVNQRQNLDQDQENLFCKMISRALVQRFSYLNIQGLLYLEKKGKQRIYFYLFLALLITQLGLFIAIIVIQFFIVLPNCYDSEYYLLLMLVPLFYYIIQNFYMIYYNKVLDKKCQNQFNFDINSILDNHFNQIKNQDEVLKKKFNELNFKIFSDIQNKVKENECTICLVPYQHEQQLIALKCNENYNFYHAFHKECLQLWFLDMKKDSCPLCRAKI